MWVYPLVLAAAHCGYCHEAGDLKGCDVNPCPSYNITDVQQDYVERRYPAIRWVMTKFVSTDSPNSAEFWDARKVAIMRIAGYFRGDNADGLRRDEGLPKPVITAVCNTTNGQKPCYGANYILGYLPEDGPSPQPTNPDVSFYTSPPARVFVSGFSGAWSDRVKDHNNNLKDLADALNNAGESWRYDYYYYATYTYKLDEGYEEVWLKTSQQP